MLRLLWTAQISDNQDTIIVRHYKSDDLGQTWGGIVTLSDKPGTFIRQPIAVPDNGNWLLPIFYYRTQPGKKWVGNDDISAVKISADDGHSWRNVEVSQGLSYVHANITMLHSDTLVALSRNRWTGNIYISHSVGNGEGWSVPQATELPDNNSPIRVVIPTSGKLVLVYNAMSAAGATERHASLYDEIDDGDDSRKEPTAVGRSAFWGAPHAPITVAISVDGGESRPQRRNLDEGDGYCMTNNPLEKLNREFSYPSIKQNLDDTLHIAYI